MTESIRDIVAQLKAAPARCRFGGPALAERIERALADVAAAQLGGTETGTTGTGGATGTETGTTGTGGATGTETGITGTDRTGGAPLVTVAVPAREAAGCLWRTLSELQGQIVAAAGAAELVLVDDESSDGTADLARAAGAGLPPGLWRVARSPRRLGSGGARNAAARLARGEYVWCCDADDPLPEGGLARALRAARAADGADVVALRAVTLSPGDGPAAQPPGPPADLEGFVSWIPGPWSRLVRREAWADYPEGMTLGDDVLAHLALCDSAQSYARQGEEGAAYAWDTRTPGFSRGAQWLAANPRGLLQLAAGEGGPGADAGFAARQLRYLAAMLELGGRLTRPAVRRAWYRRLSMGWAGACVGTWGC